MDPTNGIIGDVNPTELPQSPVEQQDEALQELRKKAKYSRSKEFAELRENIEERIKFYQKFLPNGLRTFEQDQQDVSQNWRLANVVIAELQLILDTYQNADADLKAIEQRLK